MIITRNKSSFVYTLLTEAVDIDGWLIFVSIDISRQVLASFTPLMVQRGSGERMKK
jgi:hypothetical protein